MATYSFFISYAQADHAWAEWIAWTLESAGYKVVIQAWDIRPGSNFVLEMDRAASEAERTVVVLSENYLRSEYAQPEWAAAFARDPTGKKKNLLLVRVDDCMPGGLLRQIVWINLVGLTEEKARAALLDGLLDRGKPALSPAFPSWEISEGIQGLPIVAFPAGPRVSVSRLPPPGPYFLGRDSELALLDSIWGNPCINLVSVVAFGGAGKSALIYRWLDNLRMAGWRGAQNIFAWSFYSQGTEGRIASAEAFIDSALRWFGDPDPTAGSPYDRGARLAELVRQERTLLVLDGMEPLQYPAGAA